MYADTRFEPKVDAPVVARPSLAGLIAWLEQQYPWARYDFCDPWRCVVGQYLQSIGVAENNIDSSDIDPMFGPGVEDALISEPWTCRAALKRIRAITAHTVG